MDTAESSLHQMDPPTTIAQPNSQDRRIVSNSGMEPFSTTRMKHPEESSFPVSVPDDRQPESTHCTPGVVCVAGTIPIPSLGAWQRPYDALIPEAIRKKQRSAKTGAKRPTIIKYIKCRYPGMKYKNVVKGVGRALKRMTKSGHLNRSCPGQYMVTPKGRAIKYRVGYKFDRRVSSQKNKRAYARSKALGRNKRKTCGQRRKKYVRPGPVRRKCHKRKRRSGCKPRRRRRCRR